MMTRIGTHKDRRAEMKVGSLHPSLKLHQLIIFIIAFVAASFLVAATSSRQDTSSESFAFYTVREHQLTSVSLTSSPTATKTHTAKPAAIHGNVEYLYDWKNVDHGTRFLIALGAGQSSSPSHDLVILDEYGQTRLLAKNVIRARFSPDGERVVYTTPPRTLNVVTTENDTLATVLGVPELYDPNWSSDGKSVVFAQSPGSTSESLRIVVLDVATGARHELTSGHTDFFPLFHPSGDWIVFVSGRTGLMSMWAVATAGGTPRQLTNIGRTRVDEQSVSIPSRTMAWSADGVSLAYDQLDDSRSTWVWVLKFDPGMQQVVSVKRLGEGLSPRWLDNENLAVQTSGDNVKVWGVE